MAATQDQYLFSQTGMTLFFSNLKPNPNANALKKKKNDIMSVW